VHSAESSGRLYEQGDKNLGSKKVRISLDHLITSHLLRTGSVPNSYIHCPVREGTSLAVMRLYSQQSDISFFPADRDSRSKLSAFIMQNSVNATTHNNMVRSNNILKTEFV
jgi:hypothetical protein